MINMKKTKRIIFLSTLCLLIIPFGKKVFAIENESKKIMIDGISIWKDIDNKWYNTDFIDNDDNYNIYINNNYFGTYKINSFNDEFIYYNNNNSTSYNNSLFAYTTNLNIQLKPFKLLNTTEEDIREINKILNTSFDNNDFPTSEHVDIDLDNNGVIDTIICVSNLYDSNSQNRYFNLLYIKLNNENRQIIINDEIKENDVLNNPVYNIKYIYNDKNNYDNIIIQKRYFSNAGEPQNMLFEYKDGKYNQVIIENEIKKNDNKTSNENKRDYTMYIFSGILLLAFLLGYLIFNKIKNKGKDMDV